MRIAMPMPINERHRKTEMCASIDVAVDGCKKETDLMVFRIRRNSLHTEKMESFLALRLRSAIVSIRLAHSLPLSL